MDRDKPKPGRAIFINGVQSSGKTTVATELAQLRPTLGVISGDELIRRVPATARLSQASAIFTHTLDVVEKRLTKGDVAVDAALTEAQVQQAKERFKGTAVFVLLRVRESDRARREDARKDRKLTYDFQPEWHDVVGPDGLYDLVLDSSSLTPYEAAQEVVALTHRSWPE